MSPEQLQSAEARMTNPLKKVVVLGGGPAGLAAAHELSARGVEVTVLERAPWVGGPGGWSSDGGSDTPTNLAI